jgi:mannose-6-phosphate isomerase-like protein (cupin superfamily)
MAERNLSARRCGICSASLDADNIALFCSMVCAEQASADSVVLDLDHIVEMNTDYLRVIHTTVQSQLTVMHITREAAGIHAERHPNTTQFLRIHSGRGVVLIEGESRALEPGTCVMVSPNAEHEVVQIGTQPLKLSSVYAPPVHAYNRVEHVRPAEEDTDKA